MAINKKLIHFKTKEAFLKLLCPPNGEGEYNPSSSNILETSICFIKDSQEIWTHGQLYTCSPSTYKVVEYLPNFPDKGDENKIFFVPIIYKAYLYNLSDQAINYGDNFDIYANYKSIEVNTKIYTSFNVNYEGDGIYKILLDSCTISYLKDSNELIIEPIGLLPRCTVTFYNTLNPPKNIPYNQVYLEYINVLGKWEYIGAQDDYVTFDDVVTSEKDGLYPKRFFNKIGLPSISGIETFKHYLDVVDLVYNLIDAGSDVISNNHIKTINHATKDNAGVMTATDKIKLDECMIKDDIVTLVQNGMLPKYVSKSEFNEWKESDLKETYVDKSSAQTITGKKTFTLSIQVPGIVIPNQQGFLKADGSVDTNTYEKYTDLHKTTNFDGLTQGWLRIAKLNGPVQSVISVTHNYYGDASKSSIFILRGFAYQEYAHTLYLTSLTKGSFPQARIVKGDEAELSYLEVYINTPNRSTALYVDISSNHGVTLLTATNTDNVPLENVLRTWDLTDIDTLSIAGQDKIGGVVSTKTGTEPGKDYFVEVLENGTMKVNVPWFASDGSGSIDESLFYRIPTLESVLTNAEWSDSFNQLKITRKNGISELIPIKYAERAGSVDRIAGSINFDDNGDEIRLNAFGNSSPWFVIPFAKKAESLKNSVTLWGQSFDGSSDISGNITATGFKIPNGTNNELLTADGSKVSKSNIIEDIKVPYYNGSDFIEVEDEGDELYIIKHKESSSPAQSNIGKNGNISQGELITIPTFSYDECGHITSASNQSVRLVLNDVKLSGDLTINGSKTFNNVIVAKGEVVSNDDTTLVAMLGNSALYIGDANYGPNFTLYKRDRIIARGRSTDLIFEHVPLINTEQTWTQFQDFKGGAGNSSDIRFKTNIVPLNPVLDKVKELEIFDYTWSKEGDPERDTFGVSALQLESFGGSFAKMVHEKDDEDKTKSVEYDHLGIIALKAIQEQLKIIEELTAKVEELQAKLNQK